MAKSIVVLLALYVFVLMARLEGRNIKSKHETTYQPQNVYGGVGTAVNGPAGGMGSGVGVMLPDPSNVQPGMGQPGMGQPGAGLPGFSMPGFGMPGTGLPGFGMPGTGFPGMPGGINGVPASSSLPTSVDRP